MRPFSMYQGQTPTLLLAAASLGGCLSAQSFEVDGTIRAKGGRGIAAARITPDCTKEIATTDERGKFRLLGLVVGCTVLVQADSFESVSHVISTEVRSIDIELNVNRLQQTVTVMDSSPLAASSPEISTTVDSRTLAELPSAIRDINRFAMLAPQVRNTGSLGTDGVYGTRLTVNGQLFRFTHYRVDGLSNYEPALGNGPQQVLPIAAVAEYKVLVNQYSSEFGRSGAGIITAVTRTGGDRFHGEGFYFLRPSGIQASPPVSILHIPNERHMWGGSAGGPLGQTSHVFASLEGNQQTRGAYIQSPTPSFYSGHQNQWFGLLNADRQWTEKQSLYLRLNAHSTVGDNANDAVGGFNQPSTARRDSGQNIGMQFTHRYLISPSVLNEVRAGTSKTIPLSYYALFPQTQIVRPAYSTSGLSDYFDTRSFTWQTNELLTWQRNRHQVRLGGDFIRNKIRDLSLSKFGSYLMSAGPPQEGETPIQFTQTFGAAAVRYGDTLASAFIQNDWRPSAAVTLNLGLRYDFQSTSADRNNLSPRFGFAWDLFASGRTILRGGAGLYYDQIFIQMVRSALQQGPASPQVTYTLSNGGAGFPAFPNSLPGPPSGAADRRDVTVYPDRRLNPYTGQFTVGIQQIFGKDWVLTANAAHNLSRKQIRSNDLNAPTRFVRSAPGQRRSSAVADATRPVTIYSGVPVRLVSAFENSGSSRYSSFDVQLVKRFKSHFQLMAHYLYGSSVTYVYFTGGPNTGSPSDWGNPSRDERGPSDYFQRHRFTAQGIVELPWNWQLSGFVIAASGLPVNPLTGVDNNGDGLLSDRPVGLGRNSFYAPHQNTLDISLMKRFAIRKKVKLELRFEGTNLLNRANFLRMNATYGDGSKPLASFLQPVAGLASSDPARQLQIGARVTF
ncbi:MAG: hypothetical protein K2X03_11245 [Bryobacteraceae bacterium]|nr:hypothetical protein [Bryobacteraceae bacterium]